MVQLRFDKDTWSQARFEMLCKELGTQRSTACGVLIILQVRSREAGLDIAEREEIEALIDVPPARQAAWFDAFVRHSYISPASPGGYTIEGNARHFALLMKRSAAGRIGGAIKFTKNRQGAITSPNSTRNTRLRNRPANPTQLEATRATWSAYTKAYQRRYGINPGRSAKVNSLIAEFVREVGTMFAPHVLMFYVRHHNPLYVHDMHTMRLAVRDAQSLLAQWRRGEDTGAPMPLPQGPRPMRQGSLWHG